MVEVDVQHSTAHVQRSTHHATLAEILDDLLIRFISNLPEEEYDSFDRLFFHIEEAHWFYEDFYRPRARSHGQNLPSFSFKEFAALIFEQCAALRPFKGELEKHNSSFIAYKTKVPVYGAVIINHTLDKVLLVKGYNSSSWSFPRGKINKDEDEVACAIREVREEVGCDLAGLINKDLFTENNSRGQRVKLFIVPGVLESFQFVTQTRNEISKIAWHSIDAIIGRSTSPTPAIPGRKPSSPKYWCVLPFVKDVTRWIASGAVMPSAKTSKSTPKRQSQQAAQNSDPAQSPSTPQSRGRKRNQNQSPPHQSPSQPTKTSQPLPVASPGRITPSRKNDRKRQQKPAPSFSSQVTILSRNTPIDSFVPSGTNQVVPSFSGPSLMHSGFSNFAFNTEEILGVVQ